MTPLSCLPLLLCIVRKIKVNSWGVTAVLITSALGAFALSSYAARPPAAQVELLSVGQGDAVLLRSGKEAALLDVGPPESANRLLGALRRRGIRQLSWVALSHLDRDHSGALEPILRAYTPPTLYVHPSASSAPRYRELQERWLACRPKMRISEPPATDRLGQLQLFWDALPSPSPAYRENERSLILRAEGPGGAILLAGDLEDEGERRWLEKAPAPVLFFKANHHGSRGSNSERLLRQLQPSFVIFSVGERNRFRFPHSEVEARLRALNMMSRRTDLGSVIISLAEPPQIRGGAAGQPRWMRVR